MHRAPAKLIRGIVLATLVLLGRPTWAGPPTLEQACLAAIDETPGDTAIAACEQAYAAALAQPEAERAMSMAALAVALAEAGPEHHDRVYDLIREADLVGGKDAELVALLLRAAAADGETLYSRELAKRLDNLAAGDWRFQVVQVEVALAEERWLDASKHLRTMRKLDAPAEVIEPLERRFDDEGPSSASRSRAGGRGPPTSRRRCPCAASCGRSSGRRGSSTACCSS